MLETLWNSRINVIAVILFAVGLVTLLLHHNLFKKILGLNIMDTASCLLLTSMGYIKGRTAPIIVDGVTDVSHYANPRRTGADRHRGVRVRHCRDAGTDHPAVPAVSHP